MPSSLARYLSILAKDLNVTGQVPSSNVLLPDTGVSAGTYGSASLVPVLTIDSKGRVTAATTSNVAGVTSFAYNTGSGRFTINTADGASFTADVTLAPFSTTNLTEGTNQYFTTARARSSISASGSLTYNSSTGALTYTQDNTDTVSEGALNLYYTSTRSRGALSATTGSAAYNNTSGVITIPGTSSHITEGTNLFYTDTRVRAALSGSTGVTYNSSTGAIAIGQAVGTTDNVTFNSVTVNGTLTSDDITSTNITASGNLTVSGNLTISGTTTTVNSTTVSVADINIELARNATTAAQANGAGLTITGPVTAATLTYTSADDRWNLNKNLTVSNVYGNLTGAVTGNASTATTLQTTRSITTTGDATWNVNFDGSAAVSSALTLATVNANVGSFGSSTLVPVITVNAKGLVTSVTTASISGSISVTGGDLTLSGTTGTAITNATLATVNANVGTFTKLTVNAKGLVTAASAATTTDIGEGTNLYYTDTRARAAHSFTAGSGAYNSSTGVITIPTNTNQLTNGAGYITGYTEVDTLATVTGRGASTSTASTFSGGITSAGATLSGNLLFNNATSPNTNYIQFGDNTGWYLRIMTSVSGTPTQRFNFSDQGAFSAVGAITGSNLSGTNTGDNPGVTSVAGVTPIVSSGGTTPSISHATSGATAGTYNNVTVNTFGHVTSGSNVAYITGYTEVDTLATVTGRGNTTGTVIKSTSNSAASLANGAFNVAKTIIGGLHFNNGGGAGGAGNQAAITFMGSNVDEAQAGIYVHNNNGNGTHMAFATTGSYATGPQIGLTLSNDGVANFPRARPQWNGTNLVIASDVVSSITATTPIVASASTGAVSLSHAASGATAGTYNNVTVNTFGHVTSGSNVAYLTSFTEADTLATVTGRGAVTATQIVLSGGGSAGGSDANGVYGLQVQGASSYASLELGVKSNYDAVIRSYGNDIHYFSGHWRTTAIASEDHSHYWYTAKSGSTNWNVYKMRLDHNGLLTATGGGAFNGITINQERTTNARIYSATTGAMGLLGVNSDGTFRFQVYGDGSNYGFLESTWGTWDINKTINGNMTLRVSAVNQTVIHTGNVGSYAVTSLSDTLATVTGRGATTTTLIRINNQLQVGQNTNGTAWIDAYGGFAYYGADSNSTGMKINSAGTASFTGSITASNFSGSSSGTNTGDQTSVTGQAGYADYVAAQTNPVGNFNVGLTRPKGASYTTTASSVTGAIKIKMPAGVPLHGMWKMTVKIYEYGQRGNGYTIELGCHLYPSTAHNKYQWMITTEFGAVLPIRYGTDGTSGCIWIGENTTTWLYPQIHVTEFSNGFNNPGSVNWTTGTWAVTIGTIDNSVAVDGPYTTSLPVASAVTGGITTSNYNSYSPTLTGGGASGTWGISISGNAASATTADQIDSWAFRNTGNNSGVNADSLDSNGITYYTAGVTNFSGNSTDGALYSQAYSSAWQHQIAGDYRSGQIALRGKNNGTWQAWRTVLDSSNYTSYSPSLTGSGASGTWGISVTGNAATASSVSATGATNLYSPNAASVVAADSAMPAQGNSLIHTLAFGPSGNDGHIIGMTWANTTTVYGAQIWLDTDPTNQMAIRGRSSAGTWTAWVPVLTSVNYNSYSPTLTGTGASGTWGISISGNAASAGNATTAGGLAVHSGRNDQANQIVRTQVNGYIDCGWINTTSGDSGYDTRLTRIYASNDNYVRYLGLTDFKVSMGLSAKNNYSRRVDWTSDANYHVGSFGHSAAFGGANEAFHGGSGFFDIWGGTNMPGGFSHIHGINMLHYTTSSLGSTGGNAYGWQMATQYAQTAGPYFRTVSGGSFSSWYKMWHDGNDGSGSGLDADLLDGIDSGAFFQNNQDRTLQVLRFTGVSGDSGVANQSYAIYQEGGGWNHPYPDLAIGYHTGIKIGAYLGYNGTRIYNNADFATQIASFGDGDNNFRSYYNVIAYASDKRLKENVVNIDNALQKVMKLNGVTFDWKKEVIDLGFQPDSWHECGVLAQEVEAVLPEAVEIAPFDYDWKAEDGSHSKSGKKYLTVKYEKLVPLLIEAMKEQQSQIEAQQKQIDQLMNLVKEITK